MGSHRAQAPTVSYLACYDSGIGAWDGNDHVHVAETGNSFSQPLTICIIFLDSTIIYCVTHEWLLLKPKCEECSCLQYF
ncbi:hypothetical protein COCVIDRAFT_84432 [Bipolaris victoriae FI3]|uniref:Uncharacterized protein n=1 Tax=Bipolaris victoriae (strain FI3) TaxID=930091 RepID=W7EXG2_BIPV3|nr:hypothetical protein COCVIDRAFT_84432 [Bipolaris victoriae FI3]